MDTTGRAYIGTKIVRAFPCTAREFSEAQSRPMPHGVSSGDDHGFAVIYPDGYTSWSPEATFEAAYRAVTPGEAGVILADKPAEKPAEVGAAAAIREKLGAWWANEFPADVLPSEALVRLSEQLTSATAAAAGSVEAP